MSRLRVHVLGGLTVFIGLNGPLPIARSCHAVLGYLVTHRQRPVSRLELAEALWPDHDANHARRCLSTALWRLKKATNPGPSMLAFRGTEEVSFDWHALAWIDSIAFELRLQPLLRLKAGSLGRNDLARLQRGVGLYRGDYLIGIDDEWAWIERQRLRNLYFDGLYHLTLAYAARSDWIRMLEWGLRLNREEPLREDVHRLLMQAYVSNGNRAKAVAQYQQCQRILHAELGVAPMDETQALYQQLIGSHLPGPATQSATIRPRLVQLRRRIARVRRVLMACQRQLDQALDASGPSKPSQNRD
jgi:DNA-binding SARP family transcriptional activator